MVPSDSPFLVVGLGNPGVEYLPTRHNLGERLLQRLAHQWSAPAFRNKFEGQYTSKRVDGVIVYLLFPLTYMNRSGLSVEKACSRRDIDPGHIIVLHDDVDLPLGRVRVKMGGGLGGHNGLKSIAESLGTKDFMRVRLGIGRPPGGMVQYVLSPFAPGEADQLFELYEKGVKAVDAILRCGVVYAMNALNGIP